MEKKKFIDTMKDIGKKHSVAILVTSSMILLTTATVVGVRSGMRIERIKRKGEEEGKPESDIRKECAKELILPGVLVATGVASGIGGIKASATSVATFATAYYGLKKEYDEHKEAIEKVVGPEKAKEIEHTKVQNSADKSEKDCKYKWVSGDEAVMVKEVMNTGTGDQLWFDKRHMRWFRSSIQNVQQAMAEYNEKIRKCNWASISELYSAIGIPAPDMDDHWGFEFVLMDSPSAYVAYEFGHEDPDQWNVNLVEDFIEYRVTGEIARVLDFDRNDWSSDL